MAAMLQKKCHGMLQTLTNMLDLEGAFVVRADLAGRISKVWAELVAASQDPALNTGDFERMFKEAEAKIRQIKTVQVFSLQVPELRFFSVDIYAGVETISLDSCPPSTVSGLFNLRATLQTLKIVNSGITDLSKSLAPFTRKDLHKLSPMIFPDSVSSIPPKYLWSNLLHLQLSNCGLANLDESLHFFPCVQHLDLSHNTISHIIHLQDCIALRILDLSHNRIRVLSNLERVLGSVTHLSLAHNEIESLDGIDKIYSLEKLDAANNLINDFAEVRNLCRLPNLEGVRLRGNPVSEGKHYRLKVFSEFIHTMHNKEYPSLDGKNMSRKEKVFFKRVMFTTTTNTEAAYSHDAYPDFCTFEGMEFDEDGEYNDNEECSVLSDESSMQASQAPYSSSPTPAQSTTNPSGLQGTFAPVTKPRTSSSSSREPDPRDRRSLDFDRDSPIRRTLSTAHGRTTSTASTSPLSFYARIASGGNGRASMSAPSSRGFPRKRRGAEARVKHLVSIGVSGREEVYPDLLEIAQALEDVRTAKAEEASRRGQREHRHREQQREQREEKVRYTALESTRESSEGRESDLVGSPPHGTVGMAGMGFSATGSRGKGTEGGAGGEERRSDWDQGNQQSLSTSSNPPSSMDDLIRRVHIEASPLPALPAITAGAPADSAVTNFPPRLVERRDSGSSEETGDNSTLSGAGTPPRETNGAGAGAGNAGPGAVKNLAAQYGLATNTGPGDLGVISMSTGMGESKAPKRIVLMTPGQYQRKEEEVGGVISDSSTSLIDRRADGGDRNIRGSFTSRNSELSARGSEVQGAELGLTSFYVGDPDYRNLSVVENMDLYLREQVFNIKRPSGRNLYMKDGSESGYTKCANRYEKYLAVFCEKVIDISTNTALDFLSEEEKGAKGTDKEKGKDKGKGNLGKNRRDQLPRQEEEWAAALEETIFLVLTDLNFYLVRTDFGNNEMFCDAPVPTVIRSHSLQTLSVCTIFFGFQRCILGFGAESQYTALVDEALSRSDEADGKEAVLKGERVDFQYMVLTREKTRTYPLITRVPKAANVQRGAFHPIPLPNVKIDNKDFQLVERVMQFTLSLGGDHDIVHYQMCYQTWRKKPGVKVPRTVILTQSLLILSTEELHRPDIQLEVLDTAALGEVQKIFMDENPLYVTFVFKSSALFGKTRKWRLCTDSRATSTRLQEECRRACSEKGNDV